MTIKAFAKVNIFLKIVGTRGNYHLISSRFMRVTYLYDTIEFEKKESKSDDFLLLGEFGCLMEQNTIFKAYKALLKESKCEKVKTFFKEHQVKVTKKIPEFAGLGGGSSDAASFLNLTNDVLRLNLKKDKLSSIGSKIGADVPFFIYNYPSANVSGIGEIVEPYEEKVLHLETVTPKIKCDTTKVYQKHRESYMENIDIDFAKELSKKNSKDILKTYDASRLNDLLNPCLDIYSKLKNYNKKGWFFSGSGSTFFHG